HPRARGAGRLHADRGLDGRIGTTQTATVVVRGLALGDVSGRPPLACAPHGDRPGPDRRPGHRAGHGGPPVPLEGALLAGIIALAMTLNMVVAAVVEVVIPLLLKRSRVDPAIASSVITTTFTTSSASSRFSGWRPS